MFEIISKIPKGETINIAFSGGVDSLASSLYFKNKGFKVNLLHFNHNTEHSHEFEKHCIELASKMNLPITVGYNNKKPNKNQSKEDFWREIRYNFLFDNVNDNGYVITGHNLSDSVETWVWSSLHGQPRLIQPLQTIEHNNKTIKLVRPFLLNKKKTFKKYVEQNGYEEIYDPSNSDNSYTRNYIRNVMMPHVKNVNPGIEKVIYKKYKNFYY